MATKKTAVIPEEEILAAATEENINEHSLHQTETEPEPDRVLSAEGAPGDADLIDICQTDSESANPEGMPIEDAARNTPEAPVSQTGSGTELPGEFPAGSDELTAPEAPASQTDSDLDEKKPEESPPARRTRKPRAKKSESDTAAAEPPGDASDGVEAPEKKPRRARRCQTGVAGGIHRRAPQCGNGSGQSPQRFAGPGRILKDQTDPDRDHSGHRTPR